MKLYMLMIFAFIKGLFVKNKDYELLPNTNEPLKLDLQFFAEPGAGGDGAGAGEGGDGEDGGAGAAGDGKDKPFAEFKTQEDLNKRLTRAEKAGQKALATSLGFETVEAMQAAIKPPAGNNKPPAGDGKEPNIDEIVEEKLKGEREKTFKRLLKSEVKVVAKELDFADYEDALALADLTAVKEDDGDLTGVEEALKALAEKKPHLLKKAGGNNFGADANNQKKRTEKERLEQLKKEAQSRGVSVSAANDPWKRN